MPTLGAIGCTVLSNEMTYLVARDSSVSGAAIINNKEGRKLEGKIERSKACDRTELVEVDHLEFRSYDDDELVVWMNPAEMHSSQERMRNTMTAEIKLLSGSVDCILLLYGQCRCQTLDIATLQEETGIPIIYLADHTNMVVDDCISAIMGSSERYLRTMKQHKGAFFITPGYVEGYALRIEGKNLEELVEEVERMTLAFEAMGNPPLIKLDNGLDGGARYHAMIDMFARTFDLGVLTIPCDMSVFENSYDWAKSVMKARTRHQEPIRVVAGSDAIGMPFSERMWEDREL